MSGKNEASWFPVAFLMIFDMKFYFSTWWAALPNLILHHTLSYVQSHDVNAPADKLL